MPYLWGAAKRLLRLNGGVQYKDTEEDFGTGDIAGESLVFTVSAYPGDDEKIELPVRSFTQKRDKETKEKTITGYADFLYVVKRDRNGDKCFEATKLVGQSAYDTLFATEKDGEWFFAEGIGLRRRRRALGMAAAMLGRIETAIASMEEDAYDDSRSEETEPVSVEDVIGNTEMHRLPEGLFVPAESGWHTGSSCNKRYPVTLHSRPLESLQVGCMIKTKGQLLCYCMINQRSNQS